MVDGRLDVRQDDAVQKFKDAAFNKDFPIKTRSMILFFTAGKNVHDHHFMGLLIQFRKALGPDMIVPALNMGSFKDKFNKIPGSPKVSSAVMAAPFPCFPAGALLYGIILLMLLLYPFLMVSGGIFRGSIDCFTKNSCFFPLFQKSRPFSAKIFVQIPPMLYNGKTSLKICMTADFSQISAFLAKIH